MRPWVCYNSPSIAGVMQATRRLKRRDDASTVGDIVGLLSPQLSKKNLASLCTRLLAMFEAGIPPARCFALIEESESRDLRRLARAVRNDIEHGATLAEAVRARGRALPAFFVEMIAAAEEAGALETALRSLADDYEAQVAHRRAFQQALTYPICIAVAAVVVIPMFSMVMLGASARQAGIFLARSLIAPAMVLSVWSAWNHFGPTRPSRAGMRAPLRNVSWIARTYDMANALRALAALYASGLSLPPVSGAGGGAFHESAAARDVAACGAFGGGWGDAI